MATPADTALTLRPPRGLRLRRRIRSDPVATACIAVLALFVLVAIFAPLLAPYSPSQVDLTALSQGPSAQHLLGTDSSGRDLLSRLIYGARTAILGSTIVVVLAALAGVTLAITAAWRGGWWDAGVASLIDLVFGFPSLLLAIGAVAVFGVGLAAPVVALGIAYSPFMARVVRGVALRERRLPYVAALEVAGCSGPRVVFRHLLPNLAPIIVVQATLAFAYATIDLAAISFIGLGVQPPTADWGLMIAQGQPAILAGHPAEAIYPGIALVILVVAVTLLGRRVGSDTEGLV